MSAIEQIRDIINGKYGPLKYVERTWSVDRDIAVKWKCAYYWNEHMTNPVYYIKAKPGQQETLRTGFWADAFIGGRKKAIKDLKGVSIQLELIITNELLNKNQISIEVKMSIIDDVAKVEQIIEDTIYFMINPETGQVTLRKEDGEKLQKWQKRISEVNNIINLHEFSEFLEKMLTEIFTILKRQPNIAPGGPVIKQMNVLLPEIPDICKKFAVLLYCYNNFPMMYHAIDKIIIEDIVKTLLSESNDRPELFIESKEGKKIDLVKTAKLYQETPNFIKETSGVIYAIYQKYKEKDAKIGSQLARLNGYLDAEKDYNLFNTYKLNEGGQVEVHIY